MLLVTHEQYDVNEWLTLRVLVIESKLFVCRNKLIVSIAQHKSITKLCRTLFKYENKMKIGR